MSPKTFGSPFIT
jgi:hypothetical protein